MDDLDGQSNLLVVIIDTNPVWWGQRSSEADGVNTVFLYYRPPIFYINITG